MLFGKPVKSYCIFIDTKVMHSYSCDGDYVGCTGASPVVIYAVDGFSCVWPGFARSLFSGENVPLLL